ncbi:MAG: squalene synthase HpnC [Rhizomicrobium sp.]|jgi:squalene synthase HpnC
MTDGLTAAELQSGKGHRNENFPVASILIRKPYRAPIMAFYRFARAADDIADHATAPAAEKHRLLDEFRSGLSGQGAEEAMALREVLAARNLSSQHAADLLEAFRRDCTILRYRDWDALMDYCRYSAMPVGRFVLDVHGEARSTWPANDTLCAALQIVNHLQDCRKDFLALNRIYMPLDSLTEASVRVEALAADKASPALLRVISDLARRTMGLLEISRPFAGLVADARLALEVSMIQKLAEDLCGKLMRHDPLSERVHHTKLELIPLLLRATARFMGRGRQKRALGLAGPAQ